MYLHTFPFLPFCVAIFFLLHDPITDLCSPLPESVVVGLGDFYLPVPTAGWREPTLVIRLRVSVIGGRTFLADVIKVSDNNGPIQLSSKMSCVHN